MIAGLAPAAAAWWALIVVLIAFISWVLTKLLTNICRGSVFDRPEGRTAVVMLFVHLADTDEGVVSQSVFLTNIFFDPFVRFLRWSHGLVEKFRRNSFGHVAITGFLDVAYVSYLSGEIDAFYPFTSLLVTVGLVGLNATRKAIVDGKVVFKTHRTCMLLQNGLDHRLPACAIILVLMHLVLGDPQLKCFVLPIIKAWCYWGGVGNLAPSLSPNLFKAFLAVAKKVRPLVKQLDAAYEAGDVVLAYQLKERLAAELARYDPYLAREYNGVAQRGLLARVRDYLTIHKSQCEVFWKRCRDLKGPFYLIFAGGATEFEPSKPPRPLLVLGAVVRPEEVTLSWYTIRQDSSSDHVIRALRSPLTRMMGCLLRDNHPEGTIDQFLKVEPPVEIASMVYASMMPGSALFGGRIVKCVAVPLDETTGQPDFANAFWTEREGPHRLHVSPPVQQLYSIAIDIEDRPPPAAVALCERVDALRQSGATAVAAIVASINDHKQAVADRLEARRADGLGRALLVVAYSSKAARRDVSNLSEQEKTEVEKLRFRNFHAMELSLVDRGVEVTVESDQAVMTLGALGALGNCAVAVLPDGTIFDERGAKGNGFTVGIAALARRGLLFTESGIMRLVANPDLLNDVYAKELDPFRPYTYINDDAREAVRSVGTAENLPEVGSSSFVKFNSGAVVVGSDGVSRPRFRSRAAVRAERAEARRAKLAEPLQALSGTERGGHTVGRFASKPRRNFQTELLDEDNNPIWPAVRALADEWRAQVAIFDARKKKYNVEWGGNADFAATDFNNVLDCKQCKPRGPKLHGGELMRHYVEALDKEIKENEPDSLQ